MSTYSNKDNLSTTLEGDSVLSQLHAMVNDSSFRTEPSYCANAELYPDGKSPFIETHVAYLKKNSKIDPAGYMSNLRLMLKIR